MTAGMHLILGEENILSLGIHLCTQAAEISTATTSKQE